MEDSTTKQKWHDKTWLVIILCIIFFPVGLFGLWKSSKISKTWKIIVTIIIGIIFLASISNDDTPTTSSSTENTTEQTETEAQTSYAKIGDEISIDNFSYMVNGIRFVKTIGDEFTQQTADGIYLIVDISVKNMDKEEHMLDNSLFKLTDESGTEFESSTDATTALEMTGQETLFLKECPPRIQKQGLLVFEVPEEAVYDLHLSGGFWSGETAIVKLTDK
ncbi:DUF4352 domain-containing protein [Candidatus Woesearchaeota archaeon]|nr:DUF4352 domain-containing protein [Candidatus Woesearchaeota archaeon]